MNKIITYTPNPALDVNTVAEKVGPDEKVRCEKPSREPGGGGINVSRALKRLGLNTTAVYTKGGAIGDLYAELINDEGFDQVPIEVSAMTRENLSVQNAQDNNMYRFVLPGAELSEKEWKQLLEKVDDLKGAEYLIASGSLPPGVPDDFYAMLSERARKYDIRFILDTSKDPLRAILKSGAFLIKPNRKELTQLVGEDLNNDEELIKAAEGIVKDHDIEIVVVSLSAEGAILATKDKTEKLPSPSIQKKESSVGAGDSMVAGIVYSLAEGKDIQESVMYGLASGSAALSTRGTELVYKQDADRLYRDLLKEVDLHQNE